MPVIVGATATPAILLPQRIGSFSDTVLDRLSRICHNCYSFQGELSLSGGLYALQIMWACACDMVFRRVLRNPCPGGGARQQFALEVRLMIGTRVNLNPANLGPTKNG
jgi:hypothetical protein